MKKIFLIIALAMFTFVGKAYAEVSYGISGALTKTDVKVPGQGRRKKKW